MSPHAEERLFRQAVTATSEMLSISTLFSVNDSVWGELLSAVVGETVAVGSDELETEEMEERAADIKTLETEIVQLLWEVTA